METKEKRVKVKETETFCKIFQAVGKKKIHQVLVMMVCLDVDEEGDPFIVEMITEYKGTRVTKKHGYPTAKLQEADFETFAQEDADRFVNSIIKLLK